MAAEGFPTTGDEALDADHRQLASRGRTLLAAIGERTEATGEVLDYLTGYAERHFAAEEAFMAAAGDPELEPHRADHRALSRRLGMIRSLFEREGASHAVGFLLSGLLRAWLELHLGGLDRALCERARGRTG